MADLLILATDDDLPFLFRRIFSRHQIRSATDADAAVETVRSTPPDLVILDVSSRGGDELAAVRALRAANPDVIIIVLTAYGTAQAAVEAIKEGAYDYLFKPFDVGQLRQLVDEALDVAAQRHAEPSPEAQAPVPAGMIGTSLPMQEVYRAIGKVAPTDMTVLITGESGTGKEMVARMLHDHSERVDKPFLALNCAAIPEPLLESELFGYERGAFTGAHHRKVGKLEVCNGGTLFLDEIGDMSPGLQTKMLRVLQDGTFERIGGTDTLKVNVRILAATNRDLADLMRKGRFRDDLYYRLKVVPIHLPPLRERGDDVVLLAGHFLHQSRDQLDRASLAFSDEAAALLRAYHWPGNVRELKNVVQGSAVNSPGSLILAEHLAVTPARPETEPFAAGEENGDEISRLLDPVFRRFHEDYAAGQSGKPFDRIEEVLIRKALTATEGNQSRAARLLGITRTTLRKRMQKHDIKIRPKVE